MQLIRTAEKAMRQIFRAITVSAALVLLASPAGAQGAKPLTKCAPDSVVAGTVCMDKYEATVWRVPDPLGANNGLVKKIRRGKATATDLAGGGATQLGVASDDYAPCADSGQNCLNDIYAVSLPDVLPATRMTWLQAQAACEDAGKRLPSNAEWQAAVMGTPDAGSDNGTTTCNTNSVNMVIPTGSRAACVSNRGAFDMVGNLYEWVADWVPRSSSCGVWSSTVSPTFDDQCLGGAAATGEPGALSRGGNYNSGPRAGPFDIMGFTTPSDSYYAGFRCAR